MEIFNVPLCWYENFCSEKSTTVHVHAVYIGAHVAIMFPCENNHNLFNETYVIMYIIIPNKNTSYGRCAYTSAVSPK